MNLGLNIKNTVYIFYISFIHRQQQQLTRVKRWLQLRNRDNQHRSKVEERRRKREEETKVRYITCSQMHVFFLL